MMMVSVRSLTWAAQPGRTYSPDQGNRWRVENKVNLLLLQNIHTTEGKQYGF